jgi:hypothetical protein
MGRANKGKDHPSHGPWLNAIPRNAMSHRPGKRGKVCLFSLFRDVLPRRGSGVLDENLTLARLGSEVLKR